ncbi:hypothetical protein I5R65_07615 [Herbaspirillum sp. AP02]|uniref:hypothetical protein n=1 Tax=unclassified Herbaspirillum TaxID=2624150 RepID=UPI0015DAEFF5|nr:MULTISPECIES: hypothetical protein [unclassified Herbaspirillum]MBG7619327.1 hypothetical protein [Herbaspirillum sp. AP02]NZD66611.1 hypothetical protein [Herbaspirillum sp. AP21]
MGNEELSDMLRLECQIDALKKVNEAAWKLLNPEQKDTLLKQLNSQLRYAADMAPAQQVSDAVLEEREFQLAALIARLISTSH